MLATWLRVFRCLGAKLWAVKYWTPLQTCFFIFFFYPCSDFKQRFLNNRLHLGARIGCVGKAIPCNTRKPIWLRGFRCLGAKLWAINCWTPLQDLPPPPFFVTLSPHKIKCISITTIIHVLACGSFGRPHLVVFFYQLGLGTSGAPERS